MYSPTFEIFKAPLPYFYLFRKYKCSIDAKLTYILYSKQMLSHFAKELNVDCMIII